MATDLLLPLERLGFADVMLWLISFALVYGVLSQANLPKLRSVRAILSIVIAFFVLLSAPAYLINTLSNLSTSLLVVLLGILVIFVFLEVAGVKHVFVKETAEVEIEGKKRKVPSKMGEAPMFSVHSKAWVVILIIVAIMLFVGAGGLDIVGIRLPSGIDPMGAAFFAMIVLAVMWLVMEKGKGD